MCSQKSSLYKKCLLATSFLITATSTLGATNYKKRLTFDPGQAYLNPQVGEELIEQSTGKKITVTGFNYNIISACFSPSKQGIFICWEQRFAYCSNYTKKDDGSIEIDKTAPTTFIDSKQDVISMPIFSEDVKQAVVYQHFFNKISNKICSNYLHLSLEDKKVNPLYKDTRCTNPSDNKSYYDSLLIGTIENSAQPLIYAALPNDNELVTITGYQDHSKPKILACGQWESGKKVNDKRKVEIKNKAWLKQIVNIHCNEGDKDHKFEFWTVERKKNGGTITFGDVKIYTTSFDKLLQGELPDTSQKPATSISLNIASIDEDIDGIIRLKKATSGFFSDRYNIVYSTQLNGEIKGGQVTKNHRGNQAAFLIVIGVAGIAIYQKFFHTEDKKL